jgi:protein-S-isoprenylcysteine O-methyltransferase Ste14
MEPFKILSPVRCHVARIVCHKAAVGVKNASERVPCLSSCAGEQGRDALVTAEAFRYIRHPRYSALICLAWGIFLQQFTGMGLALVLTATALLVVTAYREEQECLAHFGKAYQDYMSRTRRFVPFLL